MLLDIADSAADVIKEGYELIKREIMKEGFEFIKILRSSKY